MPLSNFNQPVGDNVVGVRIQASDLYEHSRLIEVVRAADKRKHDITSSRYMVQSPSNPAQSVEKSAQQS